MSTAPAYHTNQRRRGERPGGQVEAERALLEDEWAVKKSASKILSNMAATRLNRDQPPVQKRRSYMDLREITNVCQKRDGEH